MKIIKSESPQETPSTKINVLVYGMPGVGKTQFAARTEGVLIADVENGASLLHLHGIKADIAKIETWEDMNDLYEVMKSGAYKTVVIDPLGELLDKLLSSLKNKGFANKSGNLTLEGWGMAKDKFKTMIRAFRDLDVNLVLVAHTSEKKDEESMYIRPKLQANLDEDVCAMMDVVGYLRVGKGEDKKTTLRRLYVAPGEKYYAKDRSGKLPEYVENASFDALRDLILKTTDIPRAEEQKKREEEFLK